MIIRSIIESGVELENLRLDSWMEVYEWSNGNVETLVSSNATAGSALAIINAKRRCETCARLFPRVCRNEFTLAYYNVNSRLARARVINSISFCHAFCAPPPLLPLSPPNWISLVYASVGARAGQKNHEGKKFRFVSFPRYPPPFRGFSVWISWIFAWLVRASNSMIIQYNKMEYQESIDAMRLNLDFVS